MIEIRKMRKEDAGELSRLDKKCFSIPWSEKSFIEEFENELAYYFVMTDDNDIIGYIGLWNILGEGHITNIALHPRYRGKGLSKRLMNALFCFSEENTLSSITLEVRESNTTAQNLYLKYGFKKIGKRKRYYSDNKEDAIIMTAKLFEDPTDYYNKITNGG